MVDPVSLSASAAGLISLGIQACQGITQYLNAIKSRKDELASARRRTEDLSQILEWAQKSFTTIQAANFAGPEIERNIESCTEEINKLSDLVTKLLGDAANTSKSKLSAQIDTARRKVRYPFDRSKIRDLEERLSRTVECLQLTLQCAGL